MIIRRPIKTNYITQLFGQSKACIGSRGNIVSKIGGICREGYRDFYESMGMKGHNGIDIAGIKGEGVYHSADWSGVCFTEKDSAGGLGIDIFSISPIQLEDGSFSFVKMRYWHNSGFPESIHDGKRVKQGELIAFVGSTGKSSGPHVHMGLKKVAHNENALHGTKEKYYTLDKNNGYYGAIDPSPYWKNEFVGKVAEDRLRQEAIIISLKRFILYLTREVTRLKEQVGSLLTINIKQNVESTEAS